MGGLAWIMNCIRYSADGIEVMGFAGLGGVENDKITRINWIAASPWSYSLQYAEVNIYPASSSSLTVKASKREVKILRKCQTDLSPTTPLSSIIHTYHIALLLTQQLLSIPLSNSSKPAGLDGREPFFCKFKCVIICTACKNSLDDL